MPQTINTFKILILALVLAFGLQYASAAWIGPTANPPGNNAPAPINVSDSTQEKDGGFIAWAGGVFTGNGVWANQYCDENGENCVNGASLGGGSLITAADVAAGRVTQHRAGTGNGPRNNVELVNISGQSGRLVGGHIAGDHPNRARVWVDGERLNLRASFYEDENPRSDSNDMTMIVLPSIKYESSLRIEYDSSGGEAAGAQAITVRDE